MSVLSMTYTALKFYFVETMEISRFTIVCFIRQLSNYLDTFMDRKQIVVIKIKTVRLFV